jgi:hypothetical protein
VAVGVSLPRRGHSRQRYQRVHSRGVHRDVQRRVAVAVTLRHVAAGASQHLQHVDATTARGSVRGVGTIAVRHMHAAARREQIVSMRRRRRRKQRRAAIRVHGAMESPQVGSIL